MPNREEPHRSAAQTHQAVVGHLASARPQDPPLDFPVPEFQTEVMSQGCKHLRAWEGWAILPKRSAVERV